MAEEEVQVDAEVAEEPQVEVEVDAEANVDANVEANIEVQGEIELPEINGNVELAVDNDNTAQLNVEVGGNVYGDQVVVIKSNKQYEQHQVAVGTCCWLTWMIIFILFTVANFGVIVYWISTPARRISINLNRDAWLFIVSPVINITMLIVCIMCYCRHAKENPIRANELQHKTEIPGQVQAGALPRKVYVYETDAEIGGNFRLPDPKPMPSITIDPAKFKKKANVEVEVEVPALECDVEVGGDVEVEVGAEVEVDAGLEVGAEVEVEAEVGAEVEVEGEAGVEVEVAAE